MWIIRPRLAVTSRRWPSSHSLLASSRGASNTTTIYGNRQVGRLSSPPGSLLPKSARRCHHHHHYQPSLAGTSSDVAVSRTNVVAATGRRWNIACGGARHRRRSLSSQTKHPTTATGTAGVSNGAVASPSTSSSSVDAAGSLRAVDGAALLRRMATYIEEDAGAADKLGNAVSTDGCSFRALMLLC